MLLTLVLASLAAATDTPCPLLKDIAAGRPDAMEGGRRLHLGRGGRHGRLVRRLALEWT